jgi:hypothetical protein
VRNGGGRLSTGTRNPSAGSAGRAAKPAERPVPGPGAGYHSPVRSNTGDEIDRIATAIDQLESDARDGTGEPELTARIAVLWQMVGALDPELARRAQQYTAPPGGPPSA